MLVGTIMSRAPANPTLMASIAASPIALVVTDPNTPDNPIVALNAAFTGLTGYDEQDAIGRNCRFLAGSQTEPWASQSLSEAVRNGVAGFAELLNYRKDGTPFLNAVMIAPHRNEDGNVEYFVGSQMNVTAEGTSIGRRRRSGELLRRLSPRQMDVLRLMTTGLRNKQIAASLSINEKTVKMHRSALLSKLGAATSPEAVRIAVEGGLIG
jgi:PAS domain S-box-containing protein